MLKTQYTHITAVGRVWIKWGKGGEFRQILKKKKDFICFQKVTLAVSKVRHLPHLPPLRYGHAHWREIFKNVFVLVTKQERKDRKRYTFLPVSKARTHKFYIYRQCTYILYIYYTTITCTRTRWHLTVLI